MKARIGLAALVAIAAHGAARADILYCSSGNGQVTIRSNSFPAFTSSADVQAVLVSQLIQQPASVRVDITYRGRGHDSFVLVGDTMVQLHDLLRQPGDGQGKGCP